jgi:hypothetical protein
VLFRNARINRARSLFDWENPICPPLPNVTAQLAWPHSHGFPCRRFLVFRWRGLAEPSSWPTPLLTLPRQPTRWRLWENPPPFMKRVRCLWIRNRKMLQREPLPSRERSLRYRANRSSDLRRAKLTERWKNLSRRFCHAPMASSKGSAGSRVLLPRIVIWLLPEPRSAWVPTWRPRESPPRMQRLRYQQSSRKHQPGCAARRSSLWWLRGAFTPPGIGISDAATTKTTRRIDLETARPRPLEKNARLYLRRDGAPAPSER